MDDKKKQYLYNVNIPLTTYARSLMTKNVKLKETENNQPVIIVDDKQENEEMSVDIDLPEQQLLPHQQLSEQQLLEQQFLPEQHEFLSQGCSGKLFEVEFSSTSTDEVLNDEDTVYDDLYSGDDEMSAILQTKVESANKINDLLNEDHFFQSITINTERSPAELLLMILKYYLANNLTTTGLANLLKLVNYVCSSVILPETRYKINQLCNSANNITLHAVCPTCFKYLGIFLNQERFEICENCNVPVDMSNPSSQCYFAIIDPSDALREYIEAHDIYYDYVVKERKHKKDVIEDIYDGQMYRKFVANLNENERHAYATLSFNTDGAPVFESSKCSIWPIYVSLNEIPPNQRFKSIITTGLWCGLQKPEMTVFMDVFVQAMNNLSTAGIICNIKGAERLIKIYTLLACVDSQARAPMNGSSQYNANFGCDWCLHKGQYFAGSMRYPFQLPLPRERNHTITIEHAREAVNSGRRVCGIVTASPLLNLINFDIIQGFPTDYLHFFLNGVLQQVTNYILSYLTRIDIEYINKLFDNIKVPRQIGRLSRSLEHRGFWKAREYENWALYYSIPLLSTVSLNNRILKNWSLLVDALHTCLGTSITYQQLNQVSQMLHKFVAEAEDTYSLAALTYNVHQLLHMCQSIYNWGPLWTHSTFPYESANHNLLKAIHASKGVILQIVRYENIQRCTQILESKLYTDCPKSVIEYCDNVKKPMTKKTFKLTDITYIGKEKYVKNDTARKYNLSKRAKAYYKIIVDGCIFMNTRKINERSCDNYAQLVDGRFVKLIDFIVDEKREITICKVIKTKYNYYSCVIRDVLEFTHEICIATNQIWRICVFLQIENKMYIIPVPNKIHY